MPTDARTLKEQLLGLWAKASRPRRIAAVSVLAVLLLGVGALAVRPVEEPYAILFAGLAPEDAGRVIEALTAEKTSYRIEHEGTAIAVPRSRVMALRISLASRGLPKSSPPGFEVFDRQTFGTTSFVEQMNYQRALAGELARTIESLEAVKSARVLLALEKRSVFRRDEEPSSASVVLELWTGQRLTPRQIRGVVHLVASSVTGLAPDRVSVVDGQGDVLWSGEPDGAGGEYQRDLERTLARRIQDLTDRVVGPGRSVVVVTSELDTSQTDRTEELYDPQRVAIRSEARTSESGEAPGLARGLAGVRGNLPNTATPPTATTAPGSRVKESQTRNYEVGKVVSRTVGPRAQVRRLHVAILVDTAAIGTSSSAGAAGDVLARVQLLAREAAGLDLARGDRIEVHDVKFADPRGSTPEATPEAPATWSSPLAAGLGALALLAMGSVLLLVLRARRAQAARTALSLATPPPAELPAPTPHERVLAELAKDLPRGARVLSAWLSDGAEAPAPTPEPSPRRAEVRT